ncbi:MAG TPA: LysE family translocator [Acidimicrobiales bacterium]|nr:LysE family translocator [Acidimicrobiales bacterium]
MPGPGVLFIVGRGVSFGRRAAPATVVGHDLGLLMQVLLVAAGVGAVVERSIVVFDALKLAGAAYLVWLGVQAIRHRRALTAASVGAEEAATPNLLRLGRQGLVVGITNPKGFLLFAAVLSQFVDPAAGAVPVQLVLLGLVCMAIALASDSDSAWALLAGTARAWFARSPRRIEAVGAAGGVVTIGLGVRLAFARRPG